MSKSDNLAFIYFLMQGTGTLISWNAVLNGLDYYNAQFAALGFDSFTLLPIAVFVAQGAANFLITKITKAFTFNQRILGPLIILSIILFTLPIVTHFVTGTVGGFWVIMGLLFVLGFFGTIYQSSVSGLMSFFPGKYASIFLSGTGAAGLVMNALRSIAILLFSTGDGNTTSNGQIVFYFGFASLIMIGCMIIHLIFIKTEFYTSKAGLTEGEKDDQEASITVSEGLLESEGPSETQLMIQVFKAATLPILCLLTNYIQTFTFFPGVMHAKPTGSFIDPWKMVSMLTVFNIFDILGKAVAEKRDKYNERVLMIVTAARFVFFFTFVIQVIAPNMFIFNTLGFCYINIAVFGFSNGFVTTASFIMAPEKVEGKKKQLAGFLSVIALTTGIMLGTFVGYPFSKLKQVF